MCKFSHITKRIYQVPHVVWKWRFKEEVFATDRMLEAECCGVKSLSFKRLNCIRGSAATPYATATPIDRISDQAVTNMGHMDPDLMRSACFKPAPEPGSVTVKCFNRLDACYGVTPTLKQNGLLLPVRFVPGKVGGDADNPTFFETDAFHAAESRVGKTGNAITHRIIATFNAVPRKLLRKSVMRRICFGDNQQAGRVFIDAVDDPRSFLSAHAGQAVAKMEQERIDQSAAGGAGCRMDHHACGLVDDDQVMILVYNVEWNGLGNHFSLRRVFNGDLKLVPLCNAGLWVLHELAVSGNSSLGQQFRKARAGEMRLLWHIAGQRLIKTGRRICANNDSDAGGRHGRR